MDKVNLRSGFLKCLINNTQVHVTFCKFIKRFSFALSGHPTVKIDERLAKAIELEPHRDEVEEYESVSTSASRKVLVLVFLSNLTFLLRYLYFILYVTLLRVERVPSTATAGAVEAHYVTKFGCLVTDCQRLSDHDDDGLSFSESLFKLPIFNLCLPDPRLSLFFCIYTSNIPVGLFFILIGILFSLCIYAIFPLQQAINLAGNESLMFAVAPNLTTSSLCGQLNKTRSKIRDSLANYRKSFEQRLPRKFYCELIRLDSRTTWSRHLVATDKDSRCFEGHKRDLSQDMLNDDEDNDQDDKDDQDDDNFIDDCLPAIRTRWWHKQVTFLILFMFLLSLGSEIICGSLMVGYEFFEAIASHQRRLEITNYAERHNCSFRFQSNNQPASLVRGYHVWNLFSSIEHSILAACLVVGLAIALTLTYVIITELMLWVRELSRYMSFAVDLVATGNSFNHQFKLIESQQQTATETSCPAAPKRHRSGRFPMYRLRGLFIEDTKFKFLLMRTQPFRYKSESIQHTCRTGGTLFDVRLAHRELILELIKDLDERQCNKMIAEMVTKLYMNFRAFIQLTCCYSPNMSTIVITTNLLIYIQIGFLILLAKSEFSMPPICYQFLTMVILVEIIFIGIISSFHARAKLLHTLLWSLVARLCSSESIELRHLRLILFKQTAILDQEGGIALKASNFRVTYVNVIQVIIWSSTLLALALKKY